MPTDRHLWNQDIGNSYAPPWPCPRCISGTLRLRPNSLQYFETAASRSAHANDDHHIMDMEYAFSAWLDCNVCSEVVACLGVSGYEPEYHQDENGDSSMEHDLHHYPRFFSEPMPLLRLPRSCPAPIEQEIRRSFSVFFCDLSAAANHVRQSIEELLTYLGIARANTGGNFRSLGERIDELKSKSAENSDRISALRWIGNFGSHPEKLKKRDLFDAYDILEILLEDLFVGHLRSIKDIVDQINRDRRPRK